MHEFHTFARVKKAAVKMLEFNLKKIKKLRSLRDGDKSRNV